MNQLPERYQTIHVGKWVLKIREPHGPGPHPVVMLLHGWTGDENAMWVFAERLPKDALLIAPRGLYPAPEGGFQWQANRPSAWATVDDFRPAIAALVELQEKLASGFPGLLSANYSQSSLVGFSQGAALSYVFALNYPERVDRLVGLAGFLPEKAEALVEKRPLDGKAVFVAHGTQDERVPVARARLAVALLQKAGAQVTYCEEQIGHKLSPGCFRGLEGFFQKTVKS